MTDSPEELILDSDIIKTCQLMDKVQIIPQVEINSPVPDQENNIKDLKRLVENNNDETTENYEEFHHGIKCQKDDVVRKVQKSPAKNVTIQENAILANTAHEIIRGIYFLLIFFELLINDICQKPNTMLETQSLQQGHLPLSSMLPTGT